jgi:hypothetical protein
MAGMRRRSSGYDASDMGPVAAAPGSMRAVRQRLAQRLAAAPPADQPHPADDDFARRLAAAGAAVAPLEPVAYRFAPGPGGFVITAITQDDLAPVVPGTTLRWPKL